MSRVITFSRTFPSYHPQAGEPTYFVQKILAGFVAPGLVPLTSIGNPAKYHTIRAGNRWKVGDKFSPRYWEGKPYQSKQKEICGDLEIKKIWTFELKAGSFFLDGRQYDGEVESHFELLDEIAKNDGLDRFQLLQWFRFPENGKVFSGQIICWNEKIEY